VSISKRLIDLVRSNINFVLDRTTKGERSRGSGVAIEELSDDELEAELIRRRTRRDAAERAASTSEYTEQDWEEVEQAIRDGAGRFRTSGRRRPPTGAHRRTTARRPPAAGTRDPRLAQLYAQLECPYGASLDAVRKQYRALMRKYHPDMHSGNADKQRIATDLSQRLTMAYNELRRLLAATS
jgi:DnaJ-domain-containing protein 1